MLNDRRIVHIRRDEDTTRNIACGKSLNLNEVTRILIRDQPMDEEIDENNLIT